MNKFYKSNLDTSRDLLTHCHEMVVSDAILKADHSFICQAHLLVNYSHNWSWLKALPKAEVLSKSSCLKLDISFEMSSGY